MVKGGPSGIRVAAACALLLASGMSRPARAQVTLLAGETAMMGGAGSGGSGDPAMALLNPAGLARAGAVRASISATAYALVAGSVPRFFNESTSTNTAFGDTTLDNIGVSGNELRAFPSLVALLIGLGPEVGKPGHMTLGLSLLLPRTTVRYFEGASIATRNYAGRQTIAYSLRSDELYGGVSFAMQLGRRVLIGASLFAVFQPFSSVLSTHYTLSDSSGTLYASQDLKATNSGFSFELAAAVGAQLLVTDALSFGLSVTAPSLHLGGNVEGGGETKQYSNDATLNEVTIDRFDGTATINLPLRVAGGFSYRRRGSFGVVADAALIVPVRSTRTVSNVTSTTLSLQPGASPNTVETDASLTTEGQLSFAASVGGEYYLTPSWVVRAGGFFDRPLRAAFRDNPAPSEIFGVRMSHVGATLGLAQLGRALSTTVGVVLRHGFGETVAPIWGAPGARQTDYRQYELMVFMSGGFDLSEIKEAIKKHLSARGGRHAS
ncbi:MAG: hypothetical protein KC503_32875 [Myxococcales bacterium]|nr:hypothetical protein [Myxococcales bacterium]